MNNDIKHERSCGGVVFFESEGKCEVILICSNFKGKMLWTFPRGHMEAGETEKETALREIKEEVGLDAEIIGNFKEKTEFSCKENVVIEASYFAAKANSKNAVAQKGEVEYFAWLDFNSATQTLTFDCDKRVLREFIKFYEKINAHE